MDAAAARAAMVRDQLAARGIGDRRVLDAMGRVPRERFVAAELADVAYGDGPLPIAEGQTISQPFVVALMLELAELGADDRVLEVGSGCGYVTAVLGHLTPHVLGLERHETLARAATARLTALGLDHVAVRHRDGSKGAADAAPFDVILVSAAAVNVPPALREQLAPGGRLVLPVGPPALQDLERHRRLPDGSFDVTRHGGVAFVPLISGGV